MAGAKEAPVTMCDILDAHYIIVIRVVFPGSSHVCFLLVSSSFVRIVVQKPSSSDKIAFTALCFTLPSSTDESVFTMLNRSFDNEKIDDALDED